MIVAIAGVVIVTAFAFAESLAWLALLLIGWGFAIIQALAGWGRIAALKGRVWLEHSR